MAKEKKPDQFVAPTRLDAGSQTNPSPLVIEAALDRRMEELKDSIDRFGKPIGFLIGGIIVVLFVGFITMLAAMLALVNESNNFKMSAYQQLNSEVQSLIHPTVTAPQK